MEKMIFEKPIAEILLNDENDVIVTSGFGEANLAGYEEEDFENLFGNN